MIRLGIVSFVACNFACAPDNITSLDLPELSPMTLAGVVALPQSSIIAAGGTQQITLSGVTYDGTPVTAFDSIVYQMVNAADTLRVKVSASGVLTGISASGANFARINVFAFKNGVIRGDQVLAQVTSTSGNSLTFSIQPIAPDSAKIASGVTKSIVPTLRNAATGFSVTSPAVKYEVKGADSSLVDVYTGFITYINPNGSINVRLRRNAALQPNQIIALKGEGSAWIYARINAYGTEYRDSVQYVLSYPFTQTISTVKTNLAVQSLFAGQILTLAPGATITFQNGVGSADPLTVSYTFDNPSGATVASPASTLGGSAGNVTTLTGGQTSRRRFMTRGTYLWTMSAAGGPVPWSGQSLSGTILIK